MSGGVAWLGSFLGRRKIHGQVARRGSCVQGGADGVADGVADGSPTTGQAEAKRGLGGEGVFTP